MIKKHTPGPWKAHATGLSRSGLPEYQIHWSDIGECVAEVVHGTADARLIAAAPELLEALIVARQEAIGWYAESRGFDPETDKHPDWLVQSDAAIAKATKE